MIETETSILGAGWAGLLSAKKEIETNKRITLIDKDTESNLGGLLKSKDIDGFLFDVGGPHLLFSRDENILGRIKDILGENCSKLARNNFVRYYDQYIPYPFENGIYKLETEKRIKIGRELIEKMIFQAQHSEWKPETFMDWITGFFGDLMSNEYLIPYNKKIWKRPLDKIAADWVFSPGRLPFPQLNDVLKSVAGVESIGYKEQAFFYYPKSGGIYSLYKNYLDEITSKGVNILGGKRISKIEKEKSGNFIINGDVKANRIINTIPLPEVLDAIDEKYSDLSSKFDWNSVVIVGVAISQPTPNQTTVYVPDPDIVFHRYTWMSAFIHPKDKNTSNIIAEITVPKNELIDLKEIEKKTINGLIRCEAIKDENKVLFSTSWVNKYGYPIYSLDHNVNREKALSILEEYGIKSVGRWGSWHYWNTDMVMKAVDNTFKTK